MKRKLFGVKVENEFDSNRMTLKILTLVSKFIGKRAFLFVDYEYIKGNHLKLKLVDLLDENKVIHTSSFSSDLFKFDLIQSEADLEVALDYFAKIWKATVLDVPVAEKTKIVPPVHFRYLKISAFFFALKTQKDTFEPIAADWQEEYFEALHKKEIWKSRWINVRYSYAFIMAMWQKSPLGDLLEYVRKIAS